MSALIRQEALLSRLEEEISEATKQVALGMATDWADYTRRVGSLEGLTKAKRIINDMTEDSR